MEETKRLLIIGAGGFGREVLHWALDTEASSPGWRVGGLLDSNPTALDRFGIPYAVIGDPASYAPAQFDVFVCALGDPVRKLTLSRALVARGARFVTLVHPTAVVGERNQIGDGCILCPHSVVTTDATLGQFVTLNLGATVGHDAILGDGCILNPHADVNGNVHVGEGVLMGTQAVALPGVQIGDYAKVGAGAVVVSSVAAGTTVVGVPAKPTAPRPAAE
ncbi:MAG: acetyltransferase [Bryobacteraceae bacterium]